MWVKSFLAVPFSGFIKKQNTWPPVHTHKQTPLNNWTTIVVNFLSLGVHDWSMFSWFLRLHDKETDISLSIKIKGWKITRLIFLNYESDVNLICEKAQIICITAYNTIPSKHSHCGASEQTHILAVTIVFYTNVSTMFAINKKTILKQDNDDVLNSNKQLPFKSHLSSLQSRLFGLCALTSNVIKKQRWIPSLNFVVLGGWFYIGRLYYNTKSFCTSLSSLCFPAI